MSRVLVINYGMGNLRSVANAFEALGCTAVVSSDPADLADAERIVLPGVGAFIDGMKSLHAGGWVGPLERQVFERRTPFLGICLGMQLLATTGTEGGVYPGLNWVPGTVERIRNEAGDGEFRVPHIGWNDVRVTRADGVYRAFAPAPVPPAPAAGTAGAAGAAGGPRTAPSPVFYFVHSFALRPDDANVIDGFCRYGQDFAASLSRGNLWAVQYHPEKSQKAGLAVLRNFLALSGGPC